MTRGNLDLCSALFPAVSCGNLDLYLAFCLAVSDSVTPTREISVSVHSSEGQPHQVTYWDKQGLLQDTVYDPQGSCANKGSRSDTRTRYQPGFCFFVFSPLDFGFSRQGKESNMVLTSPCGTFPYNAPELMTASSYNGFQADIWSLYVQILIFISTCILKEP
jgi:hypothetical protein